MSESRVEQAEGTHGSYLMRSIPSKDKVVSAFMYYLEGGAAGSRIFVGC